MNSYNHYAYGAIGDWMYRTVAGIDTKTEAPGYKEIVIKPTIGGNLQNVGADYETNYGKISSHWKLDNGNLSLDVEIPTNTKATIYIPAGAESTGGVPDRKWCGYKTISPESGYFLQNVGSGPYHYVVSSNKSK